MRFFVGRFAPWVSPDMALDAAVVCEFPTLLGGERSLLALLPCLREAGVRIHTIVPDSGLAQAFAALGATVIPWTAGRDAHGTKQSGLAERELAAILAALRPELVHANSLATGRVVGPVCSTLGIPSIAHVRDIVGQSRAAIAGLNFNSRLLAVSHAVRDYHVAAGVDGEKTHVAYNGVDLDAFCPRTPNGWLHRELGLSPGVSLIGAVGQVSLRKGWDVLLDAARDVLARFDDAAFVLVGACYSDKAETRRIEEQLVEATRVIPRRVFWLGERDDVAEIMPELTMLAHAARQEPLGRVLLEAAASGLAIVTTDTGGTREIFPPEASAARLVAPNDPVAMAASIAALLACAEERRRLGEAARRRAVEAFDARNAAAVLLRHYREVADAAGNRQPDLHPLHQTGETSSNW